MKVIPLDVEPILTEIADGRWMAVAGDAAPLRCGSIGTSEDDARARFADDWRALVAILQRSTHDDTEAPTE